MAWESSLTYPPGNKQRMNSTFYTTSTPHITLTITHTHATHLVQCEEGFILQGFQVDLEQTIQVLLPKKIQKVRDEESKSNHQTSSHNL